MDADSTVGRVVGVGMIVTALASTIAGATITLLLTDPVAVTSAIDSGDFTPVAAQLAALLYGALATLLEYL